MASGEKTIPLHVELDFGNYKQTFNDVASAGQEVLNTIESIEKKTSGVIPGAKDFLQSTTSSVKDTIEEMSTLENDLLNRPMDTQTRKNSLLHFDNLAGSLSATIRDLQTMNDLMENISKKASPQMFKQIGATLPSLYRQVTNAAGIMVGSGSLVTDQQIVNAVLQSDEFKKTRVQLYGQGKTQKNNAQVENDLVRYAVLRAVPQIQRSDFLQSINANHRDDSLKHIFDSFQDMLPDAFRTINKKRTAVGRGPVSDRIVISKEERDVLKNLLQHNPYVAEAAEAVNLIHRRNGEMYFRNNPTRASVNALGGELFQYIEQAAKGMPMYGITDVNDPDSWDSIARKNNKQLTASMEAARMLSDSFGWMSARRYSNKYLTDIYSKNNPNFQRFDSIGPIRFSPLIRQYEVAKYTLDELAREENWNDGRTFDPAHHFAIDQSLHLDQIMSHGSGIKPHNSYTDEVIYVDIDKRLGDINLSKEDRQKIEQQYAELFEHGISGKGKNSRNIGYTFTRMNAKSGIEFVRNDIYNKIMKEDPTYFSAGLDQDTFYTWKDFASAVEYRNKNATPGQDIRNLFGSELPKKIAVVDLEDTTKGVNNAGTGLNGASVISNRLVQAGFQGRAHGIKTALMPIDIQALNELYGGNLSLKAFTGSQQEKNMRLGIDDDVDMIINAADIKNAKNRFAGMTNAEITSEILKDIQKYGIRAKSTYSDANTRVRWLSGQLAQSMQMNPKEIAMFTRNFLNEYRQAGDYNYAMRNIFGKNTETGKLLDRNPELFGSKSVQSQIADYRKSMLERMLRGDLLLPKGLNAYRAMAAPWIIDAFNEDMKSGKQFDKLPDAVKADLNALTLGDNRALFLNTLATRLGFARYPATGRSLQNAENAASTDPRIRRAATQLGLDPNAVYLSTTSPLMQWLQDADFDGDVLELFDLNLGRKNSNSVTKMMERIVEKTRKHNEELYKKGQLTDAQLAQRNAALEKDVYKDGTYSLRKGQRGLSLAKWLSAYALQSSSMGAPNATIRNAYQLTPDSEVIRAIMDAEAQYSVNSVTGKKGSARESSKEQIGLMSKFKPFSEFYRMVDKSRDEYGRLDADKLKKKNFYAVNLPFATMSGSMRSQMLSAYMAQQMGYDVNAGYDWEKIFEMAHGPRDYNSAVGRMQAALRDMDIARLNQKFIVPSSGMVMDLSELKRRAVAELAGQFSAKRANGELTASQMRFSDTTLANRAISSIGGNVIDNLVARVLTQDRLNTPENNLLFGQLAGLGFTGIGKLDFSKYLQSKGKSIQEIYGDASIREMAETDARIQKLSTLNEDQLIRSFNNLRFSPSMITSVIKNPIEWAADRLGRKPDEETPDRSNVYSLLGNYAHEAIEGFMKERALYSAQNNGPMSEDQLKEAAKRAQDLFESFVTGSASDDTYKSMRLRKLTSGELREATGAKSKSSAKSLYSGISKYLTDGLLQLFPDSEYEVAAIENVAANRLNERIDRRKVGLKLSLGKKIGSDEDIESSGYFDLLFRKRGTNDYSMVDLKNYVSPDLHDRALWKMQQLAYAKVMPDFIRDTLGDKDGRLAGIFTALPKQNTVEEINGSDLAVKDAEERWKRAVELFQAMPEIGISTQSLMQLAKSLDDLFTGDSFSEVAQAVKEAEQRAQQVTEQLSGSTGTATGAALMLHDEYTSAMDTLEGIDKAIRKADNRMEPGAYNEWSGFYRQLSLQENTINQLRGNGMHAQANMLQSRHDITKMNLDEMLPKIATSGIQDAADQIRSVLHQEQASKSVESHIANFEKLTASINQSQHAYETLQDRISANEAKIRANQSTISTTNVNEGTAEEQLEKQNRITALENENRALQNQNAQYSETIKENRTNYQYIKQAQPRLAQQAKREAWKFLREDERNLNAYFAGESLSNAPSIMDDVLAYDVNAGTAIANANRYAKKGIIKADSPELLAYIQGMRDRRTRSHLDSLRNRLTNESLLEFDNSRISLLNSIPGYEASPDELAQVETAQVMNRIKKERQSIAQRFKGTQLTQEQQQQYKDLMSFYDNVNEQDILSYVLNVNNAKYQMRNVQNQQALAQMQADQRGEALSPQDKLNFDLLIREASIRKLAAEAIPGSELRRGYNALLTPEALQNYRNQQEALLQTTEEQKTRQVSADWIENSALLSGMQITDNSFRQIARDRLQTQWERYREQNKGNEDAVALADLMLEESSLDNLADRELKQYQIKNRIQSRSDRIARERYELEETGQRMSRTDYLQMRQDQRLNQYDEWILHARTDEERQRLQKDRDDQTRINAFNTRLGNQYDADEQLRLVKEQQHLASMQLQLTGHTQSRQDRIDNLVSLRQAELNKEIAYAPVGSEYEKQLRQLVTPEALSAYRNVAARQIQIQDEALARRDKMQAAQSEFNAQQAIYASENFRRMHGSRYTKTMLGRMYDERMNYGQQLRQNEFNYKQRIREEEDRQATLNAQLETATDQADIDRINNRIKDSQQAVEGYRQALKNTQNDLDQFKGTNQAIGAVFDKITVSVTRLAQQLGRRMFQKAIQEAKRFVMEFDASMTEIQTITQKSDTQMQSVRSDTIDRAIRLRTSVGNVSQVEASLYRQGLSDAEVADRSEAIIKFATVTGSKVQDATKIITTALQNGLVESAEEAMDALTALGDNAATTAVEIGKAMQKCAAAAKVAGVSYGELTSMITVMTSTTQLSGTQVGTALNTLFSRLRQVQSTGYVSDRNGDTTDLSTIETALRLAGIDLRSDQNTFRTPTEIMYDIAKNWNNMSDVQRANITTSVAGVRAGNMFSTLMEGMAEDNGETFAKYLGLAEDSEGMTESKYEIAAKSLQASINELKSTFDGLVESLVNSGAIKKILDFVTSLISGVTKLIDNGQGLIGLIVGIGTAFAAVMAMIKGGPFGPLLAGLAVATGFTVAGVIGNSINGAKVGDGTAETKNMESYIDLQSKKSTKYDRYSEMITETKELGKAYEELGEAMDEASKNKLAKNLDTLIDVFPELGTNVDDVSDKLKNWRMIVDGAEGNIKNFQTTSQSIANTLAKEAFFASYESRKEKYEQDWQAAHDYGFTTDDVSQLQTWNDRQPGDAALTEMVQNAINDRSRKKSLLDNKQAELQPKLDEVDQSMVDLTNTEIEIDNKIKDAESQLAQLKEKKATGEYDLMSAKSKSSIDSEIERLLSELADLRDEYTNAEDEFYRLTTKQTSLIQEKNSLQAELNALVNPYDYDEDNDGQLTDEEAKKFRSAYIAQRDGQVEDLVPILSYAKNHQTEMDAMLEKLWYGKTNDIMNLFANEEGLMPITSLNEFLTSFHGGFAEFSSEIRQKFVDFLNKSLTENGFIGLMLQESEIEWKDFVLDGFNQFLGQAQSTTGKINLTDPAMKTAVYNNIEKLINGDWETYANDPNKQNQVFQQALDEASSKSRSKYFEEYNPGAFKYYTLYGEKRQGYETLGEAQEGLIKEAGLNFDTSGFEREQGETEQKFKNRVEEARRKWVIANNPTLFRNIFEQGTDKSVYQTPEEIMATYAESYVSQHPDRSSDMYDFWNAMSAEDPFAALEETWRTENVEGKINTLFGSNEEIAAAYTAYYQARKARLDAEETEESEAEKAYLEWLKQKAANVISGNDTKAYSVNAGILSTINTSKIANGQSNLFDMLTVNPDTEYGSYFGNIAEQLNNIKQKDVLSMLTDTTGQGIALQSMLSQYSSLAEIFNKLSQGIEVTEEDVRDFHRELAVNGIQTLEEYGDHTQDAINFVQQMHGSTSDQTNALTALNNEMRQIADSRYFIEQYRKGNREKRTLDAIAGMIGGEASQYKGKMSAYTEQLLAGYENSLDFRTEGIQSNLAALIQTDLNEAIQKGGQLEGLNLEGITVTIGPGGVNIEGGDNDVVRQVTDWANEKYKAILALAGLFKFIAHFFVGGNADELVGGLVVTGAGDDKSGDGYTPPRGGGGGGGKSPTDHLLEAQKHRASADDHMLKMIQFRRTRYKNAGELTNENALIEQENRERRRQIKNQRDNIDELRAQMSTVKEGSDDWYKLRDAIQAAEEAIAQHTEAIRENEKAIKENRKQIRQYKIDIQNMISGELDNREQQRRQRLQGTVDMENTILDIIKKRYQDEWDLVKKDIENKKKALEQEKSLIDERLNARKQAAQEASKYEELANLQAQLALIEKDSSRTSDAAKLRDQIRKLQDELSWSTAEQEADAQKQALDDRIKGYELYTNQYEEWLENFLSDNNNFANELNDVMKKSREDLINWLKLNDEEYANSTKEQQDLMVQNWGDMYDEMKGLSDQYWRDYWNQVAAVMTNRESFMDFMMDSEEYRKASDERKRQLREQWNEAWTLWNNARLGGAALVSDEHAGEHDGDDIDDSPKYRYKVKWEVKTEDGEFVKKGMAKGDYYSTRADAKKAAKRLAEEQAVEAQLHPSDTITYGKYVEYKHGGLVDYTGPAWVDGSKTKPEAFLSAEDTATMRSFLDSFATIRMPNFASLISDSMFGEAKGFTVEKLNIEINEAELKEDPDYEQVARRVGEEFVRELSKQGVQTANFAFSR